MGENGGYKWAYLDFRLCESLLFMLYAGATRASGMRWDGEREVWGKADRFVLDSGPQSDVR